MRSRSSKDGASLLTKPLPETCAQRKEIRFSVRMVGQLFVVYRTRAYRSKWLEWGEKRKRRPSYGEVIGSLKGL